MTCGGGYTSVRTMRWKSSLGFKTVERLLHNLNLEFASDTTESEWMSSSVHAHAKIELVCTECGSCCSPTLNNLVRNRSVACLCNGMACSFQKTMYICIVNQLHSKHLRLVNVDSYGQVMLRIEARTVESNQMSWNAWIQKRLTDSLLGIVSPGIHRLSSGRQYASEAYASPRSGTVLATESDLALHPFPLPFPDRLD